jgi:nucleotide-binding universal stress UspA family protein
MTNTIVALSDFSVASDNALRYAAALAQKTSTALVLLHAYQIPVTMNDMPVMLISADELKTNADKRLALAKDALLSEFAGLTVETESLLGDVAYEVEQWCKRNNPLAIVIGTHESSSAERLFFGSNATGIVRHLECPVFTIPQTYTQYHFANAILATDLSNREAFPARKIVDLLQALNIKLQVVHVEEKEPTQPFSIPGIESLQPSYQWIREEDVNKCLLRLVQQPETDLLIVLPHEHNLIERLFFKLHTENLIHHTSKPILTIKD